MEKQAILLFCVTDEIITGLDEIELMNGWSDLESVQYKDIYAIVSKVDALEYDEYAFKARSEDIKWLTFAAGRFMNVLVIINEKASLIPMKFLTIFSSRDRVVEILKENYNDFTSMLNELRGKEEWSVKIYCNKKAFKERYLSKEITEFESEIQGKSKGTTFLLKKKFESQLEEKLDEKVLEAAEMIINQISVYSLNIKFNKPLPKELSGRNDPMALNSSLLVRKETKEEFIKHINEFKELGDDKGLIVEFCGPWPVYNFCVKGKDIYY